MPHIPLFSHFFTNQSLIDVVLFFLLNPNEEVYLAQVVNSTGKALIQVQRTLKRLLDSGLVEKTTHKRKTYYKANLKHVAYEDVKNLVIKAKIFSPTFKDDITYLNKKVRYGFIYGSVAKSTHTPQSDIDVLLIGDLSYYDAGSFIFKLGRELAQEVNVVILSLDKLLQEIKNKNSFTSRVLQEPKIWLFGDRNEFENNPFEFSP